MWKRGVVSQNDDKCWYFKHDDKLVMRALLQGKVPVIPLARPPPVQKCPEAAAPPLPVSASLSLVPSLPSSLPLSLPPPLPSSSVILPSVPCLPSVSSVLESPPSSPPSPSLPSSVNIAVVAAVPSGVSAIESSHYVSDCSESGLLPELPLPPVQPAVNLSPSNACPDGKQAHSAPPFRSDLPPVIDFCREVRVVWSDCDGEYKNGDLEQFCLANRITMIFDVPYTSQNRPEILFTRFMT